MTKLLDLTNKKFGRLTAISIDRSKTRRIYWNCICDCGNHCSIASLKLVSGETKSCGCLRKEVASTRHKKHGLTKTSLHYAWLNMKNRCDNPKYNEYHRYGGRGITYCEEWKVFENFMKWSLANGFNEEKDKHGRNLLSLDRIDNNGNYCPENCKWSNRIEQGRNKYNNVNYEYKGKVYCLSALAEISEVRIDSIRRRIKQGWSVEDAVDTPSKTYKGRLNNGTK